MPDSSPPEKPLVDPAKPDTKINFLLVAGVVVFFAIAAWFVVRIAQNPPDSPAEVTESPLP